LFITQVLEGFLSIADVVKLAQVSQALREVQKPYGLVLTFACAWNEFGSDRTCIRDWLPVYGSFLSYAKRCGLDEGFLDQRISYKHTLFDDMADKFLQPLPWAFKPMSLEPFINFLWLQLVAEPAHFSISSGTFVEVIGSPGKSTEIGQPAAIIALDATYCESGPNDEHFNLAALVMLDDRNVALIMAWAHEIQENECFFGFVLVSRELTDLLDYATSMFQSPAWSYKEDRLQWFGFGISIPYSFEEESPLLGTHEGLESGLRSGIFLDLSDFVEHMRALHPGYVPNHRGLNPMSWHAQRAASEPSS
ncbi:unnamed protein product, partial [Symbiodinium pilosum]